jgi:hypothetical protein
LDGFNDISAVDIIRASVHLSVASTLVGRRWLLAGIIGVLLSWAGAPRLAGAQPSLPHVDESTLAASAPLSLAGDVAVADFDADGRPDIVATDAIPDRSAPASLQVELSSASDLSLPVATDDGLVTVDAIDVDNDRDVDLVVTPLLTTKVIAVFVNDGRGHFSQGDARSRARATAHLLNDTSWRMPLLRDVRVLAAGTTTPAFVHRDAGLDSPPVSTNAARRSSVQRLARALACPDPRGPPALA